MKIFLNPGHAPGIDSGAVNSAYGVTEAEICRDIGAKVKAYLLAAGCEVRILQSDNLAGESTGPNVCATANAWPADILLHCIAIRLLTHRQAARNALCSAPTASLREILPAVSSIKSSARSAPWTAV